jgi:hypothetical protein
MDHLSSKKVSQNRKGRYLFKDRREAGGIDKRQRQGKIFLLLIERLPGNQLLRDLLVMPVHQRRLEQLLQPIHHGRTTHPSVMIPGKPALGMLGLVVFFDVILVRGEDECAVPLEVDLHDAQAWRVPGGVVEGDALRELEVGVGEGLPVECGQIHVGGEIDAEVCARGDAPAGVLEFGFVDVDCESIREHVNILGFSWSSGLR